MRKYENCLIVGDLNTRSKLFNASSPNKNGAILDKIVRNTPTIILNKPEDPTFFKYTNNLNERVAIYEETLDIALASPGFATLVKETKTQFLSSTKQTGPSSALRLTNSGYRTHCQRTLKWIMERYALQ
jgi:hypothetical protein